MQDDRRVLVVGSGPPGATAALFLSNAGIDVTVLETGSERAALGLTVRVRGLTVAKWRKPLRERRDGISMTTNPDAQYFEELSPGGLTNHWSCAVPRFSPDDFQDAERAGERYAWPLRYEDLAPWYDQVEPLLHVSGGSLDTARVPAGRVRHVWKLSPDWQKLTEEAERRERSVLPLPYVYGSDTTVTFSGTVFNSYVRLVRPAEKSGRVRVVHDAHALRLEWSPDARRVSGVVYKNRRTGQEERIGCRAVVLAAGALNTTRLLLESTSSEFPAGLGNTEGVLGRYLHDHPIGKLVVDLGRSMPVHPAAYISRTSVNRARALYAGACAQWTGVNLIAKSVLRGHPGRMPWLGFNVFGTMAPKDEQNLSIDASRKTAEGASTVSLDVRHPPESKQLLEETRDELLELLSHAGLNPRVRIWKIESAGNAHHYGGTCRMHASKKFGMIDGWNRLHAAPNVVVADSSAFTTGPEKNPVLTAMALSARASDRLARDLRTGDI